jgi:hypothetical protein
MKRNLEKNMETAQREKEEAIANVYEMAGKIKVTNFQKSQSAFFGLLMLKQVKDSKEYRSKMGMNWEQFCEYAGVDRRRVDEQLLDLKPFRTEFLADFASFSGVELSKIRYLGMAVSADSASFSENAITYNGETIPIDAEHKDEIQALLETLEETHKAQLEEQEANNRAQKRILQAKEDVIRKQEKSLRKFEKDAERRGLTPEEHAFLQKMENMRIGFDGFYMCELDPTRIEELFKDNNPTPRMTAAYLSTLDYMRKQILAAWDEATDRYGNPVICPEDAWQPGMGAATSMEKVRKGKK